MDVGIIGLGIMGGRMAGRLIEAGHRVVAFDVSPAAIENASAAGVTVAGSAAEVAGMVPVVLLSLPAPAHVERAVIGEDGLLTSPRDGLIVLDTSTVDPETTRRMAARAMAAGVAYLDAPVLGRPDSCGAWTFPVGGDEDALNRARPVLESLGTAIIHAGPPGTGNAIKLLNNLMFGGINAVTAEAMALCETIGVSPRTFFEIVADSGAATVSPLFHQTGRKIIERDFDPTFTIDLMQKDVALATAMIGDRQNALTIGNAVLSLAAAAQADGLGGEDTSAVVKVYASRLAP
jgi:3-hydroxyisobutyrate dehydrogenase-like beta-hydroxyacid dehydrogenase